MAGRGRNMTLPSWMTSNGGESKVADASASGSAQPLQLTTASDSTVNISLSAVSMPSPVLNQPAYVAPVASNSFSHPLPTIVPTFPTVIGGIPSFPAVGHPVFAFPGQIPRVSAASQPQAASGGDPNNEKANWSVHMAQDGKKYWYNRVTEQSTFDKPFCLKTPEERSIPPCKWKEYSANGRKYYSDGKDSVYVAIFLVCIIECFTYVL